jgi:hypothetical protein
MDSLPHADGPKFDALFLNFLTRHIGRAATILLCISTELQAYFKFEGHGINERIGQIWAALMPLFEAKELYDEHYAAFMREKGIAAPI